MKCNVYGERTMRVKSTRQPSWEPGGPSQVTRPSLSGRQRSNPPGIAGLLLGLQTSRGNRFVQRLLDTGYLHRNSDRAATCPGSALPQRAECGNPEALQRSAIGCSYDASEAVSCVDEALHSPSQPLEAPVREFMEAKFDRDFSDVRVHTSGTASRSAQAVAARAYTVGQHIVFGEGEYSPSSDGGRRLLAHELTHTLQQAHVPVPETRVSDLQVSDPSDPFEHEAEQTADRVMQSATAGPVHPLTSGGVSRLQRAGDPKYIPPKMTCVTDAAPGTSDGTSLVGVSPKALSKAHKDQIAAFYRDWAAKDTKDFIAVEGYASSDGAKDDKDRQPWNWRFSCQRAELVQNELMRLGVPRSRIITYAHGETDEFSSPDSKDKEQNRRVVISTVQVGPKAPPPVTQNVSVPSKTEVTTKTPGETDKDGTVKKKTEVEVKTIETKQVAVEQTRPGEEEEIERWFALTYEFDLKQDFPLKSVPPPAGAPQSPFLCDHGVMQVGGKVNVGVRLGKYVELFNEPELDFNLLPEACGSHGGITAQVNVLKLNLFKKRLEADLVGIIGLPDGWATGLHDAPFTGGGQLKIQTPLHKLWAPLPNIKIGVFGGVGWQQGVLDPNRPGTEQPGTTVFTVGGFLGTDWDFGPVKK